MSDDEWDAAFLEELDQSAAKGRTPSPAKPSTPIAPPRPAAVAPSKSAVPPRPPGPAAAKLNGIPPKKPYTTTANCQPRPPGKPPGAGASPAPGQAKAPPALSAPLFTDFQRRLKVGIEYIGKGRITIVTSQATAPGSPVGFGRGRGFPPRGKPAAIAQTNTISVNDYPKSLTAVLASVAGGRIDALTGADPAVAPTGAQPASRWTWPYSSYKQLEDTLRLTVERTKQASLARGGPQSDFQSQALDIDPLPPWVVAIIVEFASRNNLPLPPNMRPKEAAPRADQTAALKAKIPPDLLSALHPFQRQGLDFALSRNGRVLIGDEMGLGKTLQGLAIAAAYKEDWPVLVVAPSSMRLQWASEVERWFELSADDINVILTSKKQTSLPGSVVIVSYQLVEALTEVIRKTNFGVIICDESHYLKAETTKRTKATVPLIQETKRAVLLSGTPAVSRPSEMFSQLNGLNSKLFTYFGTNFGMRYCNPVWNPFKNWNDFNGAARLEELYSLLTESLMIRRLKAQVLSQMPAKKRHRVDIDIPAEQKDTINAIAQEWAELRRGIGSGNSDKDSKARGNLFLTEMFRNAGRAKLPSATRWILNRLRDFPTERMLIFSHHMDSLDGIAHRLHQERMAYIRIDGRTPSTDRQALVELYQKPDGPQVALLGITAAGVGITLTRATCVVFAELFWNPGSLQQAEDRAHRIGQTDTVNVYYLIGKDTIDEMIWEVISRKLLVLGQLLSGHSDSMDVNTKTRMGPSGDESADRMDRRIDDDDEAQSDGFISYLLHKVTDYFERRKAWEHRREVRAALRSENCPDLDTEDGARAALEEEDDEDEVGTKNGKKKTAAKAAGRGKRKRAEALEAEPFFAPSPSQLATQAGSATQPATQSATPPKTQASVPLAPWEEDDGVDFTEGDFDSQFPPPAKRQASESKVSDDVEMAEGEEHKENGEEKSDEGDEPKTSTMEQFNQHTEDLLAAFACPD